MANSVIGKVLNNRYRIDEFLGRGGMAEVYKVWDQDRAVHLALKMLNKDLARDIVFLRRFRREAQNLAALQHPNIVRFYGLEQDGLQAFMLMDYIEGEDLKTEIFLHQGRGVPPNRILELIKPVCSAVAYAHKQGVVHCDLKPANILIENTGGVLVTDFGIARLTDAATATMVGAGTPAYMAPEQVKGLDPVPQTDIYALGVVLYEMLTGGERPFTGEQITTTGTTSAKVRWEQVNLEPRSPRLYNPKIFPEMESIVLKCLAKNPVDRYQTALQLLNAIERGVDFGVQTKQAAPESLPVKKQKTIRVPPKQKANIERFVFGVLIVLVCVIGSIVVISGISRIKSANQSSRVTPLSELPSTWTPIGSTPTEYPTITPTIEPIKELDLASFVPSLSDLPESYALEKTEGPDVQEYGIRDYLVQFSNNGAKVGDPATIAFFVRELPNEDMAITNSNELLEGLSNEYGEYQYYGSSRLEVDYDYVDDTWVFYWVEGNDLFMTACVRIDHINLMLVYTVLNVEYTDDFDTIVEPFEYLDIAIKKVGEALGK